MRSFTVIAYRVNNLFYSKHVKDVETLRVRKLTILSTRPCFRACRSRCQPHRKRHPRHCGPFVSLCHCCVESKRGRIGPGGYTMKHIAGLYIVWLVAAGLLGISLLGPCMTVAYAQPDVQTENV